jgi:predicted transcriptional regulator
MTRKLDKEHLEEIQSLRDQFAKNSAALGNIAIEEHVIERQLEFLKQEKEKLFNAFSNLQEQEQTLLDKMRERYGDGQINIADGTFTAS